MKKLWNVLKNCFSYLNPFAKTIRVEGIVVKIPRKKMKGGADIHLKIGEKKNESQSIVDEKKFDGAFHNRLFWAKEIVSFSQETAYGGEGKDCTIHRFLYFNDFASGKLVIFYNDSRAKGDNDIGFVPNVNIDTHSSLYDKLCASRFIDELTYSEIIDACQYFTEMDFECFKLTFPKVEPIRKPANESSRQ